MLVRICKGGELLQPWNVRISEELLCDALSVILTKTYGMKKLLLKYFEFK